VLHSTYYWPSIFKDVAKYVRSCDSCQRIGIPTSTDKMPLCAQVMIEPFEKWALDFVGPISPMSHRKNYILVCTDYVTKWVEAKSLFRATENSVVEFIYEDIFTCFGVPHEIVTDQGTQFTSKLMKELTEKYGIKHCKSSPYHP
jgi:transposase InsO family protein